MKLLAQTDWNDVDFAMGYTFSFPYCVKWYELPSGGFLRSSQPYETMIIRKHWWQEGIEKTELKGDVHTVPMSCDEMIADMLNKGLAQDEAGALGETLGDKRRDA